MTDSPELKRLAVEHYRRLAAEPLPEPLFVVAEDDLVTVCFFLPQPEPEHPGSVYPFYAFDTYRIVSGAVVESWSGLNKIAPLRIPPLEVTAAEPPVPIAETGAAEQAANKRRVSEFFRNVFDAQDAGAVKNFVAEDYRQHAVHLPTGRAGLEGFIRQIFPDGPRAVGDTLVNPPVLLLAEGDLVVSVGCIPQPEPDDPSRRYPYYVYDVFRVTDGMLAEHWSGINMSAMPRHD